MTARIARAWILPALIAAATTLLLAQDWQTVTTLNGVDFAGLTPGFVGLYQVNVVVPQGLPAKAYPLQVVVRGNISNSLNVPVQPRNP